MKRVIFALGVLFVFACSKTEVPAIPPVVVIQEEAIKFTTNLDTGTYNVADTLPLVISVSSKLPSAGVLYSILVNWTDSSKQIFKLDTSLTVSSLSLNIPGLKKTGSYSLSVTVTSKSTSTNTVNKSIPVVNNPLGRFMGYKVVANARQLGTDYWEMSHPGKPGVVIRLVKTKEEMPTDQPKGVAYLSADELMAFVPGTVIEIKRTFSGSRVTEIKGKDK